MSSKISNKKSPSNKAGNQMQVNLKKQKSSSKRNSSHNIEQSLENSIISNNSQDSFGAGQQTAIWQEDKVKNASVNQPLVKITDIDEVSSQMGQSALISGSSRNSVSGDELLDDNELLIPYNQKQNVSQAQEKIKLDPITLDPKSSPQRDSKNVSRNSQGQKSANAGQDDKNLELLSVSKTDCNDSDKKQRDTSKDKKQSDNSQKLKNAVAASLQNKLKSKTKTSNSNVNDSVKKSKTVKQENKANESSPQKNNQSSPSKQKTEKKSETTKEVTQSWFSVKKTDEQILKEEHEQMKKDMIELQGKMRLLTSITDLTAPYVMETQEGVIIMEPKHCLEALTSHMIDKLPATGSDPVQFKEQQKSDRDLDQIKLDMTRMRQSVNNDINRLQSRAMDVDSEIKYLEKGLQDTESTLRKQYATTAYLDATKKLIYEEMKTLKENFVEKQTQFSKSIENITDKYMLVQDHIDFNNQYIAYKKSVETKFKNYALKDDLTTLEYWARNNLLLSKDFITQKLAQEVLINLLKTEDQRIYSQLRDIRKQLNELTESNEQKLDKIYVEEIRQQVVNLPTLDELLVITKKTDIKLEGYDEKQKYYQREFENAFQIINRYDEVLCEKANKISIIKLEEDFKLKIKQQGKQLSEEIEKFSDRIDEQGQSNNDLQNQIKSQMHKLLNEVAQELREESDFGQAIRALGNQIGKKAEKAQIQSLETGKANQEDVNVALQQFNVMQRQLQHSICLLKEAISLHCFKADDTVQGKYKKAEQLQSQIDTLSNWACSNFTSSSDLKAHSSANNNQQNLVVRPTGSKIAGPSSRELVQDSINNSQASFRPKTQGTASNSPKAGIYANQKRPYKNMRMQQNYLNNQTNKRQVSQKFSLGPTGGMIDATQGGQIKTTDSSIMIDDPLLQGSYMLNSNNGSVVEQNPYIQSIQIGQQQATDVNQNNNQELLKLPSLKAGKVKTVNNNNLVRRSCHVVASPNSDTGAVYHQQSYMHEEINQDPHFCDQEDSVFGCKYNDKDQENFNLGIKSQEQSNGFNRTKVSIQNSRQLFELEVSPTKLPFTKKKLNDNSQGNSHAMLNKMLTSPNSDRHLEKYRTVCPEDNNVLLQTLPHNRMRPKRQPLFVNTSRNGSNFKQIQTKNFNNEIEFNQDNSMNCQIKYKRKINDHLTQPKVSRQGTTNQLLGMSSQSFAPPTQSQKPIQFASTELNSNQPSLHAIKQEDENLFAEDSITHVFCTPQNQSTSDNPKILPNATNFNKAICVNKEQMQSQRNVVKLPYTVSQSVDSNIYRTGFHTTR